MRHIRHNLYTLMVSALLGATTAASAGEENRSFSGFYGGIEVGTAFDQKGQKGNSTQLYYGGLAGYRHQASSNFVFGLESTFGKSTSTSTSEALKDAPSGNGLPFSIPPGEEDAFNQAPFIFDNKYQWSVAATAGHVFGTGRNNLLYGKVGIASQRRGVWDIYTCRSGIVCLAIVSYEKLVQTHSSLLVGAGYERSIADHFNLRLSVDYIGPTDLNEINVNNTYRVDLINAKFSLVYQF